MTGQGQRSISYQPALDGLRGVAVTMVLLFHLGFDWMSGGYLGVSVFFTLSGFLITTLLVTELQRSGDIALGRFYGRRARRLLPASLICLVAVCLLIAADLVPDRSGLRWYVAGSLFQFANWVPLGLQNSYGEIFQVLSPLDHFWSLAIEEQFYWLWPITLLGLFRAITRKRGHEVIASDWLGRLLRILTAMFVVFALSAPLTGRLWGADAAYFATWARVPEILAGAVLAVVAIRFRLPSWVTWMAPVALTIILVLAIVTPPASGFAYAGALPAFALISAALIAGLQRPSPVASMLSLSPVVYLGRISYGVYLYHWPVFVVLTASRTGLGQLPLSVLRLAVTMAVSVASYVLVEQPIRERRFLARPRIALMAVGVSIPLVALLGLTQVSNSSSFEQSVDTLAPVEGTFAPLITVLTPTTPPTTPTSGSSGSSATSTTSSTELTTPLITTPPTDPPNPVTVALSPDRPVRMLVIGDSTALATAVGLTNWADEQPQLAQVEVQGFGGCGLMNEGERLFKGEWLPESDGCRELFDVKIPQRVRDAAPDIVVVISSFWEVTDHRLADDPTPRSIIDPQYREAMLDRFTAYNQTLLDAGAPRVVWVLHPRTDYAWDLASEPADDPARYQAFYDIQRIASEPYPTRVSIIDFASWSDERGLTSDQSARLDGVHWTPEVATMIAEDWLGNEIVQAALH